MSDNRKKSRRRRSTDEAPSLTPIEKSIAKYVRFQCPTKKGMFNGMQVVYFNSTKAVECLTESKWSSIRTKTPASESGKDPVCFSSKHDAVQMLRKFLESEMFCRVVKVYKEEKTSSDQTSSNNAGDISQSNTPRTVRQRKGKSTAAVVEPAKDDEAKEKEKTKKKKFKFELHEEQTIVDSPNEFYVWIYSPTTAKQYIIGALLVIGCIGVCLFPLWPPEVRTGVYYLSMVLASLLGVLLSLAVFKYILFAGVWLMTMGKVRFWLLPNLTEDVGFVESFVPFYTLHVNTKKKVDVKKENVDDNDAEEVEEKSSTKKEDLNEEKQTSNQSNVIGQSDDSEGEDEDKEKSTSRSSSIDDVEEGNKRQKSSDEDFEVLSKEELDTK